MSLQKESALSQELIELRRDFHRYPEPGWLEYRTSSKIADLLEGYGYDVFVGNDVCETTSRMGVPSDQVLKENEKRAISENANPKWMQYMKGGHTGVVGVLKSETPGPTIALRFDIDSLEIQESNQNSHLPIINGFHSKHKGRMHACGHDGHAAIGIGVAKRLMEYQADLCGEIRLLFQPAEEGCRGAQAMVDKGWLDGVDYFFGGHIAFQSFQLGEIVTAVGGFLSTTKLDVSYIGHGSHAGDKPEQGRNALLAAATASIHLHGITRHSEGKTRINVGELKAGSGRNVIPDLAEMEVETRGETTELNEFMTKEAIRIIESAATTYDVECKWVISGQAASAKSGESFMLDLQHEIENIDGVNKVTTYKDLNASEDVVSMINRVHQQGGEASFLLFGSPIAAGHHKPLFDYDENVIDIAMNTLTHLVFKCTEKEKNVIK